MHLYIPSYSTLRRESRIIAMGLIIVGAALGMYMNFYFGNIGWNNILMMIALLLLPNWRNLAKFRLPFVNKIFIFIIIFQFLCITYMVVGGTIDPSGLIFMLFTVFMLIGIMSQNNGDMPLSKVILYAWLLGWICLSFCVTCVVSGDYYVDYVKGHSGTGSENILVDLTMAGNIYTFIITCLFYLNSSGYRRTLAIIGIIIGLIAIITLGKRTPLLITLIVFAWYVSKFHTVSRKVRKRTLLLVIGLVLLIVGLIQIPGFSDQFLLVWNRSIDGISDMLNGTTTTGLAAVERYKRREWAISYIDNEFSTFNYIFGAGYMTHWLDAPLLQAYLDIGIMGFCSYLYFVIVKPLKVSFSKLSYNHVVFWGCTLNFYNIFSSLNSGTPYGHIRWIPLIVLILTIHHTRIKTKNYKQLLCQNSV